VVCCHDNRMEESVPGRRRTLRTPPAPRNHPRPPLPSRPGQAPVPARGGVGFS
jgi:hypothetical protein